jgi:geranylgeranyl diphosphate synthase type I
MTAPDHLAMVAALVDERLDRLFRGEEHRWRGVDAQLGPPLAELARFCEEGGKRLRPAFCYWAFVGAGGDPDEPRLGNVCASLELLHAFALIHDDVMDGSGTRRNRDTIHVAFAREHRERGWRGESRRFGEGVAVLLGDLAFVYADQLMAGAPADALRLYTELRIELTIGQYLDLLGAARGDVDEEGSRRIAHYKTAKYTIERPLHLGAALAGRFGELGPALSAFGLPLGEAFQLRDDLLGVLGDEAVTGKPVGDDLREGKATPVLALAVAEVRRRRDHPAARLLARVGAPDLGQDEVQALRALLVATGAVAEAERRVERLVAEARHALAEVALTPPARQALSELATYVADRRH